MKVRRSLFGAEREQLCDIHILCFPSGRASVPRLQDSLEAPTPRPTAVLLFLLACSSSYGYGGPQSANIRAMTDTLLENHIAKLRLRLRQSAQKYDRAESDILLLAVSKTQPAAAIRAAYACGLSHFGESYVQEASAKIEALADLPLTWHFIGPLQSNKTRAVAEQFHWVHSVEREKTARRLSEQRPQELAPLQVCLQVNISGEHSKSGVAPDAASDLAAAVASLPRLTLRGLMAIPAATDDVAAQREAFAGLRREFESLRRHHPQMDTLSMGMSRDLEAAIAEGSTLVRIGTAIFGPRRG